ncbi:MAG: YggS family pyridoxal phosphate enzyme [Phycisphaerales bacterium]|nr:YggS family pyridoxal phosphate enzyme [Phycisphaerales bacterium]
MPPRLAENVARVRARIDDACRKSGRQPGCVRIVAVTKYAIPSIAAALIELGLRDLGENRVQQLVERAELLGATIENWSPGTAAGGTADGASGPRSAAPVWHMIGHLQRNKVKAVLGCTRIIHSVDSIRLAEEIAQHASALGIRVDVFMEVNVAGEESKDGAAWSDAPALAQWIGELAPLNFQGLMTMAPLSCPGDAARPYFAKLRDLRDDLVARGIAPATCRELSMGMSADYAAAVEEGASVIRIGSTLFEGVEGYSDPRQ